MKVLIAAAAVALATPAANADLLRRAVNPNPTLQAYTASAHLDATLHAILPIHKSYNGTVTYERPKRTIEFANVSGALSRFKDLATSTPSYDQAAAKYTITPLSDDGSITKYSLVPKDAGGRVKSLILSVDDRSALCAHAQWNYTNGGQLNVTETYMDVNGYHLPSKADIAARFPGYSVDGTLTFSDYQF